MEISFSKIKQTPIDISYKKDNLSIVGTLERISRDNVKLISILKASTKVTCNRCGKEINLPLDYPLELILSEGRYNGNDEIDVIEFFDGKIDFDYLAKSEIISFQESYNYCDECISCIDNDEILEVEF